MHHKLNLKCFHFYHEFWIYVSGKSLPTEIEEKVIQFYESEKFMQKRLLRRNLKWVLSQLKNHFPEIAIHFSKCASLRPKYCVLIGSNLTHAVSVYRIHENMNLLLKGITI